MMHAREQRYAARFAARVRRVCQGGKGDGDYAGSLQDMLAKAAAQQAAQSGHALRPNDSGTPLNPPGPADASAGAAAQSTAALASAAASGATPGSTPQSLGAGNSDAQATGAVIAPTLSGALPLPKSGLPNPGGAATKTLLG
ncbi:MAG TPA: hypothetical protein VH105_00515 [Burkholderiales bacterium]|jgi:hypothetical protein|nr:hypothetical protein [Burkholderiales bacterium]